AFAFGDFISFDERQKKRKQRKTLPRQGKPGDSLVKGFFYATSCRIEKRRTSMCGALRVCEQVPGRRHLQRRGANADLLQSVQICTAGREIDGRQAPGNKAKPASVLLPETCLAV